MGLTLRGLAAVFCAVVFSAAIATNLSAMGAAAGAEAADEPSKADPVAKLNALVEDADAVEKGRQVYGNTCLFCHGPKGVGARAPNLVEGMFKPGRDGEIPYAYDVIVNGRPGTIMGSFQGTITEEEVWHVMAYLRSEGQRIIDERKQRLKRR